MCNYSFFIGVDISKSFIDVSCLKDGAPIYIGQFANSSNGFVKLVKSLCRSTNYESNEWFVCFENTGIYSKPLLEFLINKAIPCKEESALKISRSLGLRRGKDDKVDSRDICQYAYEKRDSITTSKLPSLLIQKLRKLLSRRDFLVRQRQSLRVSLKEQKGFINDDVFNELSKGNNLLIEVYDNQIKVLENSIQELIDSDEQVAFNDSLARSVIGIGAVTSAYIIAVTENYTTFDDPRKFACYCGVAPFPNRSGKRKGTTRVSHIANKKMKSLFSNCTMSAINFDPEISQYYKRKKSEGKKAGVVVNAVKNKLIQRVFSVVKRKTPYVKLMSYA